MQKQYKITPERKRVIEEELVYLKTVRENEVADLIKEARAFGDLSENSEYDEAKNEQGKLYSRIAELENVLTHAVIIDEDSVPTDEVTMGSRVTVVDLDTEEKEDYHIVGSQDVDVTAGRISDESPFGKALLGRRIGDTVVVEAPSCTLTYRVAEIGK